MTSPVVPSGFPSVEFQVDRIPIDISRLDESHFSIVHLEVDLDQQTRDLSRRPSGGGRVVCGAGLQIVELSSANAHPDVSGLGRRGLMSRRRWVRRYARRAAAASAPRNTATGQGRSKVPTTEKVAGSRGRNRFSSWVSARDAAARL